MRRLAASIVVLASCTTTPRTATIGNRSANPAPLAIAILFNGQEIWVGNDDFETDPGAQYHGALHALERGLDKLVLPDGAIATIVTYSIAADVIVPLEPATSLRGSQLGDQKKYRNKIGTDLVPGVILALDQLEKANATRKLLIVIGDGNDTNNDTARAKLAEQAKRATAAHIGVRAIILKSVLSAEGQIISSLTPDPQTLAGASELETLLPKTADVAR